MPALWTDCTNLNTFPLTEFLARCNQYRATGVNGSNVGPEKLKTEAMSAAVMGSISSRSKGRPAIYILPHSHQVPTRFLWNQWGSVYFLFGIKSFFSGSSQSLILFSLCTMPRDYGTRFTFELYKHPKAVDLFCVTGIFLHFSYEVWCQDMGWKGWKISKGTNDS